MDNPRDSARWGQRRPTNKIYPQPSYCGNYRNKLPTLQNIILSFNHPVERMAFASLSVLRAFAFSSDIRIKVW